MHKDSAHRPGTGEAGNFGRTADKILADRRFNPFLPFVPESWLGAQELDFLDPQDLHLLNHIRAFSYIHMLGNYKDLVARHVAGIAAALNSAEPSTLRTLFHFCEEEMLYQQMFAQAEQLMQESCATQFGRYFDARKHKLNSLAGEIMGFPALPRAMILQALEWSTQRHFRESVLLGDASPTDPLFADLLKIHWVDENQVKIKELEVGQLAKGLTPRQVSLAFDDVLAIASLIGETFVGQVEEEIATLQREAFEAYTDEQLQLLRKALLRSMERLWAEVALNHPDFHRMARELSPEGAAKLGIH